jgi:hypothetical protein
MTGAPTGHDPRRHGGMLVAREALGAVRRVKHRTAT